MMNQHPFDQDLQRVLDTEEAYHFLPFGTWIEGGCGLLACALKAVFKDGDVVTVGRTFEDGIYDHLCLKLKTTQGTVYIDYDGIHSKHEMLRKVSLEWKIEEPKFGTPNWRIIVKQGIVTPKHNIAGLTKHIRSRLGNWDKERIELKWSVQ